jgi:hypothetical protein
MKKTLIILILSLFLQFVTKAQKTIFIEASSQEVKVNKQLTIVFWVASVKANDFKPPTFEGFKVVGKGTSDETRIVKGVMENYKAFLYNLKAKIPGTYKIKAASAVANAGDISSEEIEVVVLPKS